MNGGFEASIFRRSSFIILDLSKRSSQRSHELFHRADLFDSQAEVFAYFDRLHRWRWFCLLIISCRGSSLLLTNSIIEPTPRRSTSDMGSFSLGKFSQRPGTSSVMIRCSSVLPSGAGLDD